MLKPFTLLVLLLCAAPAAYAVDLRSATNQQLLDELSRRLNQSPLLPPSNDGDTLVTFRCDSSNYLYVELLTAAGSTTEYHYNVGSHCSTQATHLQSRFTRVGASTFVAFCSADNYMFRLRLDGVRPAISEINHVYIGEDCLSRASVFNGQPVNPR